MKDPLDQMKGLVEEIKVHADRLARNGRVNRVEPVQELIETVMPLLRDFAQAVFAAQYETRVYLTEEVEPLLQAADLPTESVLFSEDSEQFTGLLLRYRAFLEEAKAATTGDGLAKLNEELTAIDEAVARIGEITVDEEEEVEGDDDDEDPSAPPGALPQ